MAIDARFLTILLLLASIVSQACAQEGAAQVGRAINDLAKYLKQGGVQSLSQRVRDCYQALSATSKADAVAYCFALDYGASRIDQILADRSRSMPQAYLSIEKVLTRANRALSAIKIEQAERGPLIAFWSNSSRAMLKNWAASDQSRTTAAAPVLERAKIAVLKLVKNPGQARVTGMQLRTTPNMRGEPTQVVCGFVSEGTASGNRSSERPFVFFTGDQSVNYDNGVEDLDREVVKNFCTR
jgi:hypothetical protein